MASTKIQTSLIGRKVRLGDNMDQRLATISKVRDENPGVAFAKLPPIPGKMLMRDDHKPFGQKEGEIVSIYLDDGKPVYTIEVEGSLIDVGASSFDVLPLDE